MIPITSSEKEDDNHLLLLVDEVFILRILLAMESLSGRTSDPPLPKALRTRHLKERERGGALR